MVQLRSTSPTTRSLASFLADVRYEDLPADVIERTKDLFLDWVGSALAGRTARPVVILENFAQTMGPTNGPSEVLPSRRRTSPYFASMINGASSHVVEQDDVHNRSIFHPATVVFPAVLAVAQATGASGRDLITSSVVGYEAGVRIGSYLGPSHYKVFHTTGTAGTLASAAAVAHLLGADEETMLHALGSAGTQGAGLWEFLRDAADSKQLHCAKAASDGLLAAYAARDGLTGASTILEGSQGMAAGMSPEPRPAELVDGLGTDWAVLTTSFKFHASCRHTHPAADALLKAVVEHDLKPDDIKRVNAHVYQAAIDVLGPVTDPRSIHQAKFSMGFVLSLIARHRRASVTEFTEDSIRNPELRAFMERVEMTLDPEVDAAHPDRWLGRVDVELNDGRMIQSHVDEPKGDPGNTLSRDELEEKARQLAAFQGGATENEINRLIERVWGLQYEVDVTDLFAPGGVA